MQSARARALPASAGRSAAARLVDADTDLTNTLTRIRRRSWERIWLAAAYGLALVSLAVWLSDGNPVRSLLEFCSRR